VAVSGDFDGKAAERWKSLLALWRPEKTALKSAPAVSGRLHGVRIRLVEKNDLSQTTIMLGQPTIGELDSRRNALSIANYILGGGNFSSRLMKRIRSEAGKTYGIASQLFCRRDDGVFTVSTTTQNHQLSDVIQGIRAELSSIIRDGVEPDEVAKAKQFAIGHLAFELEGIANVVDKLLWLRFYDRKNAFIEKFGERIDALDVDQINMAVRACLDESKWVICAVGKKDEILSALQAFGAVRIMPARSSP
jgi:zinc protease